MGDRTELDKKGLMLSDLMEFDTVVELDNFATTFNYLYKLKRKHLRRIEDIEKGLYVFGKQHPNGHVVYTMEAK